MPYYEKSKKGKIVASYRRAKPSKKTFGKKVKNTILRMSETKRYAVEVTEQSLSSAVKLIVDEVSAVDLGTNHFQRIGAKINPTGFYWNYLIHNNSSVPVYVRMFAYLAEDEDYDDVDDLFRLSGSTLKPATLIAENLRDCTAMLNKNEMKIIYDKTHRIAGLGDGTGIETVHRKVFKKLSGSRNFDSKGAVDSVKNNLRIGMICRSADNDSVASIVEVTYNTIYYFKDM